MLKLNVGWSRKQFLSNTERDDLYGLPLQGRLPRLDGVKKWERK